MSRWAQAGATPEEAAELDERFPAESIAGKSAGELELMLADIRNETPDAATQSDGEAPGVTQEATEPADEPDTTPADADAPTADQVSPADE